jgi:hypothetical protein
VTTAPVLVSAETVTDAGHVTSGASAIGGGGGGLGAVGVLQLALPIKASRVTRSCAGKENLNVKALN